MSSKQKKKRATLYLQRKLEKFYGSGSNFQFGMDREQIQNCQERYRLQREKKKREERDSQRREFRVVSSHLLPETRRRVGIKAAQEKASGVWGGIRALV